MKRRTLAALVLVPLTVVCGAVGQTPLGPEITYQANILQSGAPLNGTADFQFSLFTAPTGGTLIGAMQPVNNLTVVDGQISVELNFGAGAFTGAERFLEIAVRSPAGGGAFTTLTPRQPLTAVPYALYALTGPGSGGPWAVNGNNISNTNTGNVGIGTTAPQSKLHVAVGTAVFDAPGGAIRVTKTLGQLNSDDLGIWNRGGNGGQPFAIADWNTGSKGLFINTASGNVGIGTSAPTDKLQVVGGPIGILNQGNQADALWFGIERSWVFRQQDSGAVTALKLQSVGGGGNKNFLIETDGFVGIGTLSPQAKLDVNGTTRTKVLEITGADLAEKFPTTDKVEPGMVVAIDPKNEGKLCLANSAYDRRVAGVVSGANNFSAGAVLGNLPGHEDAPPIALSGRVYVWCDASSAAIQPGDFLTTSDTAGHAMKAADLARAQGAIIGKAMQRLESGRGLVLVLVNLQ